MKEKSIAQLELAELVRALRHAANTVEDMALLLQRSRAAQQELFDFDWRNSWQDAMDGKGGAE